MFQVGLYLEKLFLLTNRQKRVDVESKTHEKNSVQPSIHCERFETEGKRTEQSVDYGKRHAKETRQ